MRSRAPRPELRRFARRLPVAALAAAALWLVAQPLYGPALCGLAEWLARVPEYPRVAQVDAVGDAAVIGRSDLRADSGRLSVPLAQITFNLIPFLALVLATPGALGGRGWRRLALGLAIACLVHALGLVAHVKFFYAFSLGAWSEANYSAFAREVIGGLRYFFDIPVTFSLPVVLWVGLFADRVFAVVGLAPVDRRGG